MYYTTKFGVRQFGAISILNRYGKQGLDKMLQPLGIDWHMLVALLVIHQAPGISQARLAPFLQTDKGNITKLLHSMDAKKLIKRKTDEADKRNKLCFCTDEGEKLAPELYETLKQWEAKCFGEIPKEELSIYNRINEAVARNMMKEWDQ